MSEVVRLEGYVSKWRVSWGFVRVPSRAPDWVPRKYFLHASKIMSGIVKNGLPCSFEIAPPRLEGELEQAVNVHILAEPVAP